MFNSAKLTAKETSLVKEEEALKGRDTPLFLPGVHRVFGDDMSDLAHYPHQIIFGLGCFWGAERLFWQLKGVLLTAAGYAGGFTANPTYDEVCTGATGHTEVVAVAYDPDQISLGELLSCFWENHDPTQGMRQGNDLGSQYRSAIYCRTDAEMQQVLASLSDYQARLKSRGHADITTELRLGVTFYFAEPFHQQYLDANPAGYCGLKGTGVRCSG